MAILSPKPVIEGHTLVVPEEPIEDWFEMPPELAAKAMLLGQVVSRRMVTVLRPSKVTLHAMGYREPHVHLKVIPSYAQGDTEPVYVTSPRPRASVCEEDLIRMQEMLTFPDELAQQTDNLLDGVVVDPME